MEPHNRIYQGRYTIFLNNLIGGVGWAIGATIGISIIFAVIGILIKNINLVPFIGNFISDIIKFVALKNPNLLIK